MGILGLGRTVKMYTNLLKKKKLVWTKLFQKKKKNFLALQASPNSLIFIHLEAVLQDQTST